tara:strand:+ start:2691 stop:3899 length:1209 start_codon:yes stop_codon:yes gene_type:complete
MNYITIFSKHYWPENFKINDISFKLKKKFKISVFTSEPGYNNVKYYKNYKNNLRIKGIKVNYIKTYLRKKNTFLDISRDYISYILRLFFSLNDNYNFKSNAVITFATSPLLQALPAIYYAKKKNIPSILWVQDLWPEVLEDTGYIKNGLILKFFDFIVKKIYLSSDLILTQSVSFKKHIQKKYQIKKKIFVLHQPSEIKFQKYSKISKKKVIITYAGNLGEAQDFDTILNAFLSTNLDKNIFLNIIGSGKKFEYIKNFINRNKLKSRISLKQYLKPSQLKKYFKRSTCFLVSLKNGKSLNKTIPGKFQSYLAYGKPILVSSKGCLGNLIKSKEIGFSNNPNEIKKIVKNMNNLNNINEKEKIKIYLKSKKVYEEFFELNKIVNDLSKHINYISKKNVKKNLL